MKRADVRIINLALIVVRAQTYVGDFIVENTSPDLGIFVADETNVTFNPSHSTAKRATMNFLPQAAKQSLIVIPKGFLTHLAPVFGAKVC